MTKTAQTGRATSSAKRSAKPASSTSSSDDAEPRVNVLIAFPYWSDSTAEAVAANADKVRLLIDSGAFTAWKAGKTIPLDDYCRFLEKLPVKPWRYFTLDVIGDPEGSRENYERMRNRGFNPVPIFTRGEDPKAIDEYYATSDVVGVGGLVGTQDNKGFVNGIMKIIGGRRVHWLGFTNLNYLKHYRPYMCDSSSWEAGARYGQLKLYMGGGRTVTVSKASYSERPGDEITERIKWLGFDPFILRNRAAWHGGETTNRKLCAASSLALSLDIQKNLGTLMFNAIADAKYRTLRFFLEAFDNHNRRNAA